jgi:hypothetical protein
LTGPFASRRNLALLIVSSVLGSFSGGLVAPVLPLLLKKLTLRHAVMLSALLLLGSGVALLALRERQRQPDADAARQPATGQAMYKALLAPFRYLQRERSLAALYLFLFFRTIGVAVFPI